MPRHTIDLRHRSAVAVDVLARLAGAEERAVAVDAARERAHAALARRCRSSPQGSRLRRRSRSCRSRRASRRSATRQRSSHSAAVAARAERARDVGALARRRARRATITTASRRPYRAIDRACHATARRGLPLAGVDAPAHPRCARAPTPALRRRAASGCAASTSGCSARLEIGAAAQRARDGPHELERALRGDLADQHRELRRRDRRRAARDRRSSTRASRPPPSTQSASASHARASMIARLGGRLGHAHDVGRDRAVIGRRDHARDARAALEDRASARTGARTRVSMPRRRRSRRSRSACSRRARWRRCRPSGMRSTSTSGSSWTSARAGENGTGSRYRAVRPVDRELATGARTCCASHRRRAARRRQRFEPWD